MTYLNILDVAKWMKIRMASMTMNSTYSGILELAESFIIDSSGRVGKRERRDTLTLAGLARGSKQ